MNISELLKFTSYVKGYDAKNTFSQKRFGSIYFFNKVARVKPNSSILEVSMMIQGSTDKILPAKEAASRSVAAHKVMIAIRGVEQEVLSAEQLCRRMRLNNSAYKDEEAYPDDDLLAIALDPERKPFEGKTIMPQANGSYVLITDQIKKDNEIRVWCSCSSYYWVFQYYNVENNVDIWGKAPARYIPKTKAGFEAFSKNQPMRNPGRHPGMCKHIMLLLALLMDSDVIGEARSIVRNYKANIERFKKVDRMTSEQYNKIIKEYASDHRRLNQKRDVSRTESAGFASLAGMQRKNVGWSKDLKWNPNTGHWRKT